MTEHPFTHKTCVAPFTAEAKCPLGVRRSEHFTCWPAYECQENKVHGVQPSG